MELFAAYTVIKILDDLNREYFNFIFILLLLKMFLSRRSDGGVYTCTAYNTLGNIQDTSKCTVVCTAEPCNFWEI